MEQAEQRRISIHCETSMPLDVDALIAAITERYPGTRVGGEDWHAKNVYVPVRDDLLLYSRLNKDGGWFIGSTDGAAIDLGPLMEILKQFDLHLYDHKPRLAAKFIQAFKERRITAEEMWYTLGEYLARQDVRQILTSMPLETQAELRQLVREYAGLMSKIESETVRREMGRWCAESP